MRTCTNLTGAAGSAYAVRQSDLAAAAEIADGLRSLANTIDTGGEFGKDRLRTLSGLVSPGSSSEISVLA